MPQKLVISTSSCLEVPELKPIYESHPEYFGVDYYEHNQMILCVFIMRQKSLREKSFFAPYINMMPHVTF